MTDLRHVFQISMVSGILAYNFGAPFALITSLSVATYVLFTLTVTQASSLLQRPNFSFPVEF